MSYQALTRQMRSMIEVARENKMQVVLVIREGTKLSKNLRIALEEVGGTIVEVSAETIQALAKTLGTTLDTAPMIIPKKFLEGTDEFRYGRDLST